MVVLEKHGMKEMRRKLPLLQKDQPQLHIKPQKNSDVIRRESYPRQLINKRGMTSTFIQFKLSKMGSLNFLSHLQNFLQLLFIE